MAKLIQLEEAATMLGMSAEELTEMRDRNEIHGYRDGASWKFKQDEVERVAQDKGIELHQGSGLNLAPAADDDDLDNLLAGVQEDEDFGDDIDSILVSEGELGHSGETTSSTIIGKKKEGEAGEDSDIQLASTGSEVELTAAAEGSDLSLVAGGSDALGTGSDLLPGGDAGASGVGEVDTGGLGSDLSLASDDDDLELAMDSSLTLEDDADLSLAASASDVSLADDEDDDLVLSTGSSDLTLGAGDSGINLSPTDSGLSLEEEPLDLGGSSVEQLELPEDDDVISLDEESTDPDAATQLKADDEFLLTPVEEYADDESSGSQVIALEDSEVYADSDAATMLGAAPMDEAQPALVAEDADMLGMGVDTTAPGMTAQPMVAPASAPSAPEAKYSVWNVLTLMMIMVVMVFTGMFMVDLVRNMVEYESTTSTSMIDAVIEAVGLSK